MSISTFPSLRLFVYGALSCLDLALTYQLIQKGGGFIYESNPVAEEWLRRYGWTGLVCFKLLAVSIAAFSVVLVSVYRPRVGSLLLNFALVVVSVVVLYSFSLSNLVGESLNSTVIGPNSASAG